MISMLFIEIEFRGLYFRTYKTDIPLQIINDIIWKYAKSTGISNERAKEILLKIKIR